MSVPLVWTMHNQHHVTAPTALGIPGEFSWVLPMLMVIIGGILYGNCIKNLYDQRILNNL